MNSKDNHSFAETIFKFSLMLLLSIIPAIAFFLWKSNFNIDNTIDHAKFGTFGDFVGGVLGSIWALAGVLLFYIALKDQKEDIRLNREALLKQIEALELQNNEFSNCSYWRTIYLSQNGLFIKRAIKHRNSRRTHSVGGFGVIARRRT